MGLPSDLVQALHDAYAHAPTGDVAVRIHLFGIKHADRLDGVNLKALCGAADVRESWATEIHKGMRLAEYVTVR